MSSDYKTYLNESLEFLDNSNVQIGLYSVIILYIIFVIPLLTPDVSHIFNNTFVQIFLLFLIIYISYKDIYLGILLLIAFIMSLHMDLKNMLLFSIPKPKERPTNVPGKILLNTPSNVSKETATPIEIADVPQMEQFEPMGYNDNSYRDTADFSAFDSAVNSSY